MTVTRPGTSDLDAKFFLNMSQQPFCHGSQRNKSNVSLHHFVVSMRMGLRESGMCCVA